MRFATQELAEFFAPAFAVRQGEPDDLPRDQVWELYVGAGNEGAAPASLIPSQSGGEICLSAGEKSYLLWMGRHASTLYAVDREARRAFYWAENVSSVPAWERSRPFLPILQVMLDQTPWIAVHAAAIAWAGKGALLVGAGRAGKTSLSLAGMAAGWRFVGDDHVLLRTNAEPRVAPIFTTARLRDDMVGRFPWVEPLRREISTDMGDRRHELTFGSQMTAASIGDAPLREVILLDRRGADGPVFSPASRTSVLAPLIANTAIATPGYEADRAAKLFRLLSIFSPKRFDPGVEFGPALDSLAGLLT
jgi:hypothetical protein